MTLIAFGSVTGSPGVTRLAIGVAGAWTGGRQRRIVVEADPDGGRLGAELGVGVEPGLMAVALASRSGPMSAADLLVTGAAVVGGWFVMPGPPSGEQASSVLAHASRAVAGAMRAAHDDVWLVDTGRLSTRSAALPFARAADHTVLVTAGSFPALQLVPSRVDALQRAGCHVELVVIQPTSWRAAEVAEFAGADVLAVLPHVRSGPRDDIPAMASGSWRAWWRAIERLSAVLAVPPLADSLRPDDGAPPLPSPSDAPPPSGPRWPA